MLKRFAVFALALFFPFAAMAQVVPESSAREAILVDFDTGTVLYAKNADTRMSTASMSKVMTAYMVFEALKAGRLTLDTRVPVSERAWRMEGSRTYLELGSQVRVEDLLKGLVIQSGNDAAVALAEAVGGTEDGFASLASQRAKEIGMLNSHFANASGLPNPDHYSTARDLATLAMHVIKEYPDYYKFDGEREFTYNNIRQQNRNPLLAMNIGADGVKTGYTAENGYGLIGSAVQNGRRLIVVANGLPDEKARADEGARLLQWGFATTGVFPLLKAGQEVDRAAVWLGQEASVPLVLNEDIKLAMRHDARRALKAEVIVNEPIAAPVAAGIQLGKLRISAPDIEPREYPLYARNAVGKLGFFGQISAKLSYFVGGQPEAAQ